MLIFVSSSSGYIFWIFIPPMVISPDWQSQNLAIRLVTVVFPEPDEPTRAVFVPCFASKVMFFKTEVSFS